jgi:hypothetical protein
MSERFETYQEAFRAAVMLARELKREVGLWKSPKGYYKTDGYCVGPIPRPENRYGWETRCQVVSPGEPL